MKPPKYLYHGAGAAALCLSVLTGAAQAQDAEPGSQPTLLDKINATAAALTKSEPEASPETVQIAPKKDSSPIGILPNDREGIALLKKERNPFHLLHPIAIKKKEDKTTEESTIRDLLGALEAKGASESSRGLKVLLGDLHLQRGMEVPRLLPVQTKRLIVTNVTRERVEFAWLDKTRSALGQKFVIPIDLTPHVPYILPGQEAKKKKENNNPNQKKWGVSGGAEPGGPASPYAASNR